MFQKAKQKMEKKKKKKGLCVLGCVLKLAVLVLHPSFLLAFSSSSSSAAFLLHISRIKLIFHFILNEGKQQKKSEFSVHVHMYIHYAPVLAFLNCSVAFSSQRSDKG